MNTNVQIGLDNAIATSTKQFAIDQNIQQVEKRACLD